MPDATVQVRAATIEQTATVAATLADRLRGGDIVVLTGDLGAGKTAFVQAAAVSLGVSEPVTSPTFTLAHRYEGRLVVNHLDVYRLEQLSEVTDLGLAELLTDDAVTFIEWGEAISPTLPSDHLRVRMAFAEVGADSCRTIDIEAPGPLWSERLGDFGGAVDAALGAAPP